LNRLNWHSRCSSKRAPASIYIKEKLYAEQEQTKGNKGVQRAEGHLNLFEEEVAKDKGVNCCPQTHHEEYELVNKFEAITD